MGYVRKPKKLELQGFIFMITKHIPLIREKYASLQWISQYLFSSLLLCPCAQCAYRWQGWAQVCQFWTLNITKASIRTAVNYTGWLANVCVARPRDFLGRHSCFMLYHLERGSQKYRNILKAIWDCEHIGRGMYCAGNYKSRLSFKIFHSLYEKAVRREGKKETWLI